MTVIKYVPGYRVGRLVVVLRSTVTGPKYGRTVCVCDCGNVLEVTLSALVKAEANGKGSCGCARAETMRRLASVTIGGRARAVGVSPETVRRRMRAGQSFEEAVVDTDKFRQPHTIVVRAADGFTGSYTEHARRLGISKQAVLERIYAGATPEEAVSRLRSEKRYRWRRVPDVEAGQT